MTYGFSRAEECTGTTRHSLSEARLSTGYLVCRGSGSTNSKTARKARSALFTQGQNHHLVAPLLSGSLGAFLIEERSMSVGPHQAYDYVRRHHLRALFNSQIWPDCFFHRHLEFGSRSLTAISHLIHHSVYCSPRLVDGAYRVWMALSLMNIWDILKKTSWHSNL